jgi:Protein of unknown function (DUF4242)
VHTYLVECYVPGRDERLEGTVTAARRAAEQLSAAGTSVRYVRSTLLPGDETCFHVFEAESSAAVDELARHAGLVGARIAEVIEERIKEEER